MKKQLKILGVDPGEFGHFILYDGARILRQEKMPVEQYGDVKRIDHNRVVEILQEWDFTHVFCERAKPMGQGMKQAFNYGRYFESLLICFDYTYNVPVLVDPSVWAKRMHRDINADLKPKAKSMVAVETRYPKVVKTLPRGPRSKKLLDGPIDAFLIAAYGYEILTEK